MLVRASAAAARACRASGASVQPRAAFSSTPSALGDLFNPTEEHQALRDMVRSFAQDKVDPQRLEHDREEKFNHALFKELGDLGLLGVTTDVEYGGSGMDATAACIVHEELSRPIRASACRTSRTLALRQQPRANGNED